MSDYVDVVKTEKQFAGNVIVKIGSDYFGIRQPDSGLSISSPRDKCVASLTLNPTTMDVRRVTTTVSSVSFKLLDKDETISELVAGDAAALIGAAVTIYLGRTNFTGNSNNNMAFSEYYALPTVYIKKCEHGEGAYVFSATEETERMAKPIYDDKSALAVDILAATTEWTMRDDISGFPSTGFLKCEDEFVSYSGLDLVNNRFTGVIRGELGSTPADHDANEDCVLVETVTDNPLNIIMKILMSDGGGGTYDTLQRGLGIDDALVDIDEIEELRDDQFLDIQITLSLYDIASALKYMEDQILMPFGLRLTNSINSKLTLAQLDKARFVEEDNVINEDTMTKFPKWSIDGNKVTNVIEVQWDYAEGTNTFQKRNIFEDAASIASHGRQTPLRYSFKGIKTSLDGANIIEDFGTRLLARLCTPTPEISVNTQLDKSLQTIGDKAYIVSTKIPAIDGTLNFSSDLEIISRSINYQTGDVQFKLIFTSFTNIRSGFIAPSDKFTSVTSQSVLGVASGRGAQYRVGWKMRLWDIVANEYALDPVNEIESIDGDTITFVDAWATTITANNFRMRFADYDDVVDSQKRYAFISDNGANFSDSKPTYKVTY